MNNIVINNAKYFIDAISREIVSIEAFVDGIKLLVPIDYSNKDYAEIMRQVEAGTLVIQPADEPETP